jgi:hypothetical protein
MAVFTRSQGSGMREKEVYPLAALLKDILDVAPIVPEVASTFPLYI